MPSGTLRGRARAHAARSKGANTGEAPRPAAAEGDRARAVDGVTRGREPGRGQGTGRARRGAGRAPRRAATERMERSEGQWASVSAARGMGTGTGRARAPAVQDRARVTEGGTHGKDRGTESWGPERDPRARARPPWAPGGGHGGRAERVEGGGEQGAPAAGTAAGAVHPPRHPRNAGAPHPPPPPPPRPPRQHRPRRRRTHPPPTPTTPAPASPPRAEGGAGADGLGGGGGRGAAPAPQAQGPQGEPARGAGGARPWDPDWGMVPDPLGDVALPLVVEVYGWLSWACSGTTREMRNRSLQCRAPPEGRREPGGTPGGVGDPGGRQGGRLVSDRGGVARQKADVAGLPGRGGGGPHHRCARQQLAPPGLAQRPHPLALLPAKPATATAQIPTQAAAQVTAQTTGAREWGGDSAAGRPPGSTGPPDPRPPQRYSATEGRAPPPVGGRAGTTSARGGPLPRSPLTADR